MSVVVTTRLNRVEQLTGSLEWWNHGYDVLTPPSQALSVPHDASLVEDHSARRLKMSPIFFLSVPFRSVIT